MEEIARGPVTFGQLSTWRSIYKLPPELAISANLVRAWQVPAGSRVESVAHVLDEMQQHHESLRTGFVRIGEEGVEQVIWRSPHAPVEVAEATGDVWETVRQIAAVYEARPFDLANEPPWLLTVVTSAGAPVYVVMSIHHMAADGAALDILRSELIERLAGTHVPGEAYTCRAMALDQHSEAWAARRNGAVEYWRKTLSTERLYTPPSATGDFVQWGTLRSVPAKAAVRSLAEGLKISTTSAVLAAYCRTLVDQLGTDEVLLAVIAANRAEPRMRNMVTTLNQLMPMHIKVAPDEDVAALAQRLHWATLRAYRHACYNVDDLAPVEKEFGYNGVGSGFQYFFNFMPTMTGSDEEQPAESLAEPGWEINISTRGRNNGFNSYFRGHDGSCLECTLRESAMGEDNVDARAALAASSRAFLVSFQDNLTGAAPPGTNMGKEG